MSNTFRVAKIVYFTDLTRAGARVIPLGSLSEVQLPHVHGLALKARAVLQPQEFDLINPLIRERLRDPFAFLRGEFDLAWKNSPPGAALDYLAGRHAASLSILAPMDYEGRHWLLSRIFPVREDTLEAKLSAAVDDEFSELLKRYDSRAAAPQKLIASEQREAA
jgi:hypothetical protein